MLVSTIFSVLSAAASILHVGAGAIAPRSSATPQPYFKPPYFCPLTEQSGWSIRVMTFYIVAGADMPSNFLHCEYHSNDQCYYSEGDASQLSGDESAYNCQDQADADAPVFCSFRCYLSDLNGNSLGLMSLPRTGAPNVCQYGSFQNCNYNRDNGMLVDGGSTCPSSMANSCDGPARRRYRRDDNFTALLRKRQQLPRNALPRAARPVPS
ncbi:hypothetical protein C8F01DRAFT_1087481 [Mycena amicta]|nr:hypothetical protein C8F01DRAFT_1087481 [Mycena amicta]